MATALTREELQEQQRRLTVYQDRYDQVLMPWGRKAPEPALTETPGRYRRKVLSHAQLFLPENDQCVSRGRAANPGRVEECSSEPKVGCFICRGQARQHPTRYSYGRTSRCQRSQDAHVPW